MAIFFDTSSAPMPPPRVSIHVCLVRRVHLILFFLDSTPELRGTLVREGFAAFMAVANALEPSLREDARAVAILLYSSKSLESLMSNNDFKKLNGNKGLLKDESSEVDLIGPSLPALKVILDVSSSTGIDPQKYGKLVHGLLSACLQNVDEMG